ncbi:MAG: hypothetical protein CSA50_00180 [Gammaproteobacteria bacterium]|nr:MAG: hypothetical protein CSA50_00180 [Gammaproteobacteria bacterium]
MLALNKVCYRWAMTALLASVVVACSGLPDYLTLRYENIPQRLHQHEEMLVRAQKVYDRRKQSEDWQFARYYAEKENWQDKFNLAQSRLSQAKRLYEQELKPLYESNEPEQAKDFARKLDKFDSLLMQSSAAADYPNERLAFLTQVRENAAHYYSAAGGALVTIDQLQKKLRIRAQRVTKDYSHKAEDVARRLATMDGYVDSAKKQYDAVQTQFDQHSKNNHADYAILGDAKQAILESLDKITKYEAATQAKLDELYRSYTRILADQKIDYYVQIRRAAWCDGEYCGNGSETSYRPKRVDGKVFEYFDTYSGNLIATLRSGWMGTDFRLTIPAKYWHALNIDERANMNPKFDQADYWVEKTEARSFHKYIDIVDEKQTRTNWLPVQEDDFWRQWNNLGMAILTKPYGYYQEDSLKNAEPAGMAMVARPDMVDGRPTGSNQYGEWRTDSSGNSFWHYYGMYAFMNGLIQGGRGYSYNNWKNYNQRQRGKPFYGKRRKYGTYGPYAYSKGSAGNGRSEHARRYPDKAKKARRSGFDRGTTTSIRGAGRASRGRGPASGGK